MIEFIIDGLKGKIDEKFSLFMPESETKKILLKDIEGFFNGYKPEEGDPFLNYAKHLKDFGAEIIKVEQTKNSDGVIY